MVSEDHKTKKLVRQSVLDKFLSQNNDDSDNSELLLVEEADDKQ